MSDIDTDTLTVYPTDDQVDRFIRRCIADVYQNFPPGDAFETLAEVAVNALRRKGALHFPEEGLNA